MEDKYQKILTHIRNRKIKQELNKRAVRAQLPPLNVAF